MTDNNEGELGRNPVYIGAMLTICAVAVILNILVIVLVFKFGKFRTSIDIFVTNLAGSDIVHAGIVLPLHFSKLAGNMEDFRGNSTMCKLTMFIPLVTISAAIYTMVAIAIDRYRVIVMKKSLFRKGALITVAGILLTSAIVSAPQLYEYDLYNHIEPDNTSYVACGSEGLVDNFEEIYAIHVFILTYCIPLVSLVACYSMIMAYLNKHSKRLNANRNNEMGQANGINSNRTPRMGVLSVRSFSVLKVLFSITVVFVALWTPYFIIFVMTEATGMDDSSSFGSWPHLVSRTMSVFSTVSNAVLYLVANSQFRDALYSLLTCDRCKHGRDTLLEHSRSSTQTRVVSSNKVVPTLNTVVSTNC